VFCPFLVEMVALHSSVVKDTKSPKWYYVGCSEMHHLHHCFMEVATCSIISWHNGRLLQQFGLGCMAVIDLLKNSVPNEKVPGKIALEILHLSTIFCNFGNRVRKMELRSCIFAWQKQRLITCEATHHLTAYLNS
jgi:hypothetical protein